MVVIPDANKRLNESMEVIDGNKDGPLCIPLQGNIENGTEFLNQILNTHHCVKCVHIRSYSGLYFPAFALNTERCGVCFLIQSECGKVRTRITPNTDTFYAV